MAAMPFANSSSPIGRKIDAFCAKDFDGKQYQLSDFADKKLVVVAFLGTECPLAKLYGPRLASMANEFADQGVAFVMMSIKTRDPDETGAAPSCTCSARTKKPSVCNEASGASAARRWDSADERA